MLKSVLYWLAFVPLAIVNGVLREFIFNTFFGPAIALPASAITLSLLIFLLTCFFVPHLKTNNPRHFWYIGISWLVLTTAFEFSFGIVSGKSLDDLLKAYNILSGNLWLLVLIVILSAPFLAAKVRKII